jgi:MOSC domain-containing protein YiiM
MPDDPHHARGDAHPPRRKTFHAGGATLRGLKLNEPCAHLIEVIGKPVLSALIHRCGLFPEVLEGGINRTGDRLERIASD